MKVIVFLILAWHTGKLGVTVRGLCGLQWILLCVADTDFLFLNELVRKHCLLYMHV